MNFVTRDEILISLDTALLRVMNKVLDVELINLIVTIVLAVLFLILLKYDASLLLQRCVGVLAIIGGITHVCLKVITLIMESLRRALMDELDE